MAILHSEDDINEFVFLLEAQAGIAKDEVDRAREVYEWLRRSPLHRLSRALSRESMARDQHIEQSLRLASSMLVTLQETLNLLRDILLDEIVPQESE